MKLRIIATLTVLNKKAIFQSKLYQNPKFAGMGKVETAVIGGGIIGLSTGWQLARNGFNVTLYEKKEIGSATSRVAAGMLAPQAEVNFEEEELMQLGRYSLGLYPEFVSQLKQDLGQAPGLDNCGTLLVGVNRDDTRQLKRLYEFRHSLNLKVEWLTGSEAREKEPFLSPRIASAIWLPDDSQIDNRQLVKDLHEALKLQVKAIRTRTEVIGLQQHESGKWSVITRGGDEVYDKVIITTGAWSQSFTQWDRGYKFGFRPVKGEILALKQTEACNVSTMIRTPRGYLVPKSDGTLLIGATSYEKGFDARVSAGGVKDLLEFGYEVVPAIYDLPLEGIDAGLRPATRDNSPVIGYGGQEGLYWATGHYRHGYLLAPATAHAVLNDMTNNAGPELIQKFRPERFKD